MVLFGPGWGYTKTQDFRDWRALQKDAILEIYNLGDAPAEAVVRLRAVAPNGSKRVETASLQARDFSVGRFEDWDIGPMVLQPGLTRMMLRDPFWSDGGVALLVDSINIARAPAVLEPAEPAASAAPAVSP